jgi:hypothetical protein
VGEEGAEEKKTKGNERRGEEKRRKGKIRVAGNFLPRVSCVYV